MISAGSNELTGLMVHMWRFEGRPLLAENMLAVDGTTIRCQLIDRLNTDEQAVRATDELNTALYSCVLWI